MTLRVDLAQIRRVGGAGSRVLDLRVRDGSLLAHLRDAKSCRGYGVEIDDEHVARCVKAGLNVVQQNLDAGLRLFATTMFDTVVLSQTLQRCTTSRASCARWPASRRQGLSAFLTSDNWRHAVLAGWRAHAGEQADSYQWLRHAEHSLCTLKDFEILAARVGLGHHPAARVLRGRRPVRFCAGTACDRRDLSLRNTLTSHDVPCREGFDGVLCARN